MSHAGHVKAYHKSVVLGGGLVLFPVDPTKTEEFAVMLRETIKNAEKQAYARGKEDAQRAMKQALGIKT